MSTRLLRREIEELSADLRSDEFFEGLRKALIAEGFDPSETLLAGFMEDEHGGEWGVLVCRDGKIIEYQRQTHDSTLPNLSNWVEHQTTTGLIDDFPALDVAVGLAQA